jgi:hypothetical protein
MTPQSSFMILAPVDPQREEELRRLLASMNGAPGRVNPHNALIPFARFDTLHFARLFILDDLTLGDVEVYGLPRRTYPLYLAFLGDVDGEADAFLETLARHAQGGLRAIFSCCEGFAAKTDTLSWMKASLHPSAAEYVNWRGRTLRQAREEAALYEALKRYIRSHAPSLAARSPREIHAHLQEFVNAETAAGRITLSPESPTPPGRRLRNILHLIGVPLALLLLSPLLLIAAPIVLFRLRMLEKTDPEMCLPVEAAHAEKLFELEDHELTNQFSAMGSLKPGLLRFWITAFVLLLIDYAAKHVYTRGRLARVRTIHFARWVFLDNNRRVLFASNYDGSLESYMDDFINKVGFGLNVVFSNGIGYPKTRWLLCDGSKDEQKFKRYLRRHQLPTQVWYNAHRGSRASDLERRSSIRKGLESTSMSDEELREWADLL